LLAPSVAPTGTVFVPLLSVALPAKFFVQFRVAGLLFTVADLRALLVVASNLVAPPAAMAVSSLRLCKNIERR